MSQYPLAALLKVRKYRENAAAAEVTRCTRQLEEAKQELVKREQELVEYREWRIKEEAALFEKIRNQTIPQTEVEKYKQDLLTLRGKELQYEERILEAKQDIKHCEQALEEARHAHLAAVKDRKKIDEHGNRWQEEENLRVERAEELELEEFTGKGPDLS